MSKKQCQSDVMRQKGKHNKTVVTETQWDGLRGTACFRGTVNIREKAG